MDIKKYVNNKWLSGTSIYAVLQHKNMKTTNENRGNKYKIDSFLNTKHNWPVELIARS